MMIDIRELFEALNSKFYHKLTCNKLHLLPSMQYWIDVETQEVITSVMELGDEPYNIKSIKFSTVLEKEEIKTLLIDYMAQVHTIGNHWEEYQKSKEILKQ